MKRLKNAYGCSYSVLSDRYFGTARKMRFYLTESSLQYLMIIDADPVQHDGVLNTDAKSAQHMAIA